MMQRGAAGRRVARAGLVGAVAALVVPLLSACGPATDGEHTVVTSFYPLQFIADEVAGRYNDVVDLVPPGVEPHEYELTVRQTAQVDNARVGFYEKGMAPSIDQAMAQDSPAHALDVTSVVPLHAPEPGYNEETADNEDPHFWQNPMLMVTATNAFARTMAQADPAHASYYAGRARALSKQLVELDHDYRTTLATCRIRTLVVSHDAFEYLGRRYGMDIVPIAGLEPDAEPSLQRIHQIAELVKGRGITTVFYEALASPALAKSLASDTGARTDVLDPIEGLTSADPHATYLTLMRQNLAAIAKASDCS
ncbi:MAG TPA: metal ABC transporter substrate-binding protein [Nocardioides sp.]|uniref:metal ABC transporter substrate-binding protein n=1 Tax=Nocardioides sp. TaxID=35761 RepID=UPI002E323FC7|nr:metal ABC transporter substrate-binding protein [Nocardioides sp.]HEX3931308.1 metal ABC transporter substrate-binding protein [Nocardioides sp.]